MCTFFQHFLESFSQLEHAVDSALQLLSFSDILYFTGDVSGMSICRAHSLQSNDDPFICHKGKILSLDKIKQFPFCNWEMLTGLNSETLNTNTNKQVGLGLLAVCFFLFARYKGQGGL